MIPEDYNSDREKLLFPEYGRHIQNMVKGLSTIEDKEERTRQAYVVIDVMGNLNSHLRDTHDFKHKLWDHIFILSEFKLDVFSPFTIPTEEELFPSPQKIEYPKANFGYKQYGINIRRVISIIKEKESSEVKDELIADILKFMKFKSYEYNQEFPSNEVVISHFKAFYRDEIEIDDNILASAKIDIKRKPTNSHTQRRDGVRPQQRSTSSYGASSSTSNSGTGSYGSKSYDRGRPKLFSHTAPKRYFRHADTKK